MAIALVCEVVFAFAGTDFGECVGDCRNEGFDGAILLNVKML